MKIENPDNIKINHWYTYCCHLDLYPIETQNELEDIQSQLSSEDYELCPEIWETQKEALLEIRERWQRSGYPKAVSEIDEILSKISQH